ncbi:MAG TPA: hypothetical protein VJ814_04370 [Gaiellaceae bacterium]|nr:hypothetical protein [Gaiellaceae bacterium]
MIIVRSDRVLARVDPAHGGEILDLVDLQTGRQLLGRPAFASKTPLAGDLDEETWTERYRGGWQCVTPNAGNACDVAGDRHGFHGRASNDPWEIMEMEPFRLVLRWEGHGLAVTRTIGADAEGLAIRTDWTPTGEIAALVALEHVAFGLELLEPEVEIRLPPGRAYELSEQEGPVRPPDDAPHWPDALLLDGSTELTERRALRESRSRLLAVAEIPDGWATVVNRGTGQGLRLEWNVHSQPHLWMWHEVRATGGLWRGQSEVLCIEPSTVPHSLGLARALEEGQATVLRSGERFETSIRAIPFVEAQ